MTTSDTENDLRPVIPRLSKSKFLSGLQCHKRLYLEMRHPELAEPPDLSTQAIFAMGTEIGILAQRRFPGGVLVAPTLRPREAAVALTAKLLQDPDVPAIFEGAFEHEGVIVRVDILERVLGTEEHRSAWRLIEVKSSTRVKEVHLNDLAIQRHVLIGAGLDLAGTCLMHIDTGYFYEGGEVDLEALFALDDVSTVVAERQGKVPEQLEAMKSILRESSPPAIEPDDRCHSPYECPFWAHCTKDKPLRWIYHLPGPKKVVQQLVQEGITSIDEIPEAANLSITQRRVKDNVEWASDDLARVLQSVEYPVHHLDFETVMLAVPKFSRMKPYQSIPVQWSNHIELQSGEIIHHEFLHGEATNVVSVDPSGNPIGLDFDTGEFAGDRMLSTSAEVRVPLTSVLHGSKLGVTVFTDAGTAWDFGSPMDRAEWHQGVGGGVFLIASIVRINLDIAHGLKTGDTKVHLSSGFTF